MSQYYDLDAEQISVEEWQSLMTWKSQLRAMVEAGEIAEDDDPTRIGSDHVNGRWVSTVWLGLDHNFSGVGPPLIFETMVFAEDPASAKSVDWLGESEFCFRYPNAEEARTGHRQVVERLKLIDVDQPND